MAQSRCRAGTSPSPQAARNSEHRIRHRPAVRHLGRRGTRRLATLFGTAIIYLCKLWLMDRMVWLYEEMKHDVKAYRHWLY
jgi:hypothetical protein